MLGRERELRALQAAHTDAIHSLSQKHQLQVELLQQQVLELEEKLTGTVCTCTYMYTVMYSILW